MTGALLPIVKRMQTEDSDPELLERHLRDGDQIAFARLVARYDRLVWGQCRALMANDADAEDAFQATFLTLARRARSVRTGAPLGPWLHGVAFRVCMNARRANARRTRREAVAARSEAHRPVADSSWDQALAAVAEEVQNLPEGQRVAFVLCCLEGRPVADAAAHLGLKLGTLTAQLSRARQALLERMEHRGFGIGVLALSAMTGSAAAAPSAVVGRTLSLGRSGAVVPAAIQLLTHGATNMTTLPMKLAAVLVAATFTVMASGAGGGRQNAAEAPPERLATAEKEKSPITLEARKAIDVGLEHLAKQQLEDGSWAAADYRGPVAMTALAGRAFLASGKHEERTAKAIEFILKCEDNGLLAKGKSAPMYEHGFAVQFLAEAHASAVDKDRKDRIKATLTRSVKAIVDGQNREGGWRYQPDSRDSDLTVTCCELEALAAAKKAGIDVLQATIDKGVKYVLACQDKNGRFHYTPQARGTDTVAYAHTADAVSALKAVGFKDEGLLNNGMDFIRGFKSPGVSDAFFFESRLAAAPLMKAAGGREWEAWYAETRDDLLDRRNKNGVWDDPKPGSHFNIAFALIILQSAR